MSTVYIASLADYNNGILHGVNVDPVADDADTISEQVTAMLAASPTAEGTGEPAEDYTIHNYDDFPDLGEYTSIDNLCEVGAVCADYSVDIVKAALAAGPCQWGEGDLGLYIEDTYVGEYESDEEFAQDQAESIGFETGEYSWPASYIDWTRAARDLMMDYYESGGHYFRSY